jgi:hypothetical protein
MLIGLTEAQVKSRASRVRKEHFGACDVTAALKDPLARVVDSSLRFVDTFVNFFQYGHQPFVVWGHPLLVEQLKNKHTSLFIDATFRCVPKGFDQRIIIMVHDHATSWFVPVFYVLTSSKPEDIYRRVFAAILALKKRQLNSAFVTCDFEKALHNPVKAEFGGAHIIGRLFHFKQEIGQPAVVGAGDQDRRGDRFH